MRKTHPPNRATGEKSAKKAGMVQMKDLLGQPFFQMTLPLMVTFVATVWAATWMQNKRVEEGFNALHRRIDEVIKRLERIELKLENHGERIAKLEERTSLIRG